MAHQEGELIFLPRLFPTGKMCAGRPKQTAHQGRSRSQPEGDAGETLAECPVASAELLLSQAIVSC